jgi:aminomethyltransferase
MGHGRRRRPYRSPGDRGVVGQQGPTPIGLSLTQLTRDYGSIDDEVHATRNDIALFDFSFMSRARLAGNGVVDYLNTFQSRPIENLPPGRIAYSLRVDNHGRVRSDLTLWNLGGDQFEVFSGDPRDIADLVRYSPATVRVEDLSNVTSILSLQGPRTPAIVDELFPGTFDNLPYYGCRTVLLDGMNCLVGRLGYTGEKGIELVVERRLANTLWTQLSRRARPAGFAAADCLRIEAGFILFANECALPVRPEELSLERFAGGRGSSPGVRLVCFQADAQLAREPWQPSRPCRLPNWGEITVTSACRNIAEAGVIGLGFVVASQAREGEQFVDQNAGFGIVTQSSLPLHDPRKERPRGSWSVNPAA